MTSLDKLEMYANPFFLLNALSRNSGRYRQKRRARVCYLYGKISAKN